MNPAKKISQVIETNPRSVLQAISSKRGFDLNQATFENSESKLSANPVPSSQDEFNSAAHVIPATEVISTAHVCSAMEAGSQLDHPSPDELISLRINPDTNPIHAAPSEGVFEFRAESADQIQQLAARLEANEVELQQRETQLEQRIEAWNQTTAQHQSEFEKQIHQLEQQASQVRCQQLHLMQLQTDIIKSHEATRKSIESLVLETGSDEKTLATLKALKYELSGRFDYIARRWNHLAELMQNVNAKVIADQSVNDSVDWAGDCS